MSVPQLDRCPRCGTPFMGSMRPGETPETRYCYTCNSASGTGNVQAAPASGEVELELQPLDDDSAGPKRGRIPQIAPPTRRVAVSPGAKSSRKLKAQEPAMPVRDEMPEAYAETSVDKSAASARTRGVYTGANIPQLAPTAGSYNRASSGPDFVKLGGVAAAVVALSLGAWFFVLRKKPEPVPAPQASIAPITNTKPSAPAAPKKIIAAAPVKDPAPKPVSPLIAETPKAPERSVASAIGIVGADSPTPAVQNSQTTPPAPATPPTVVIPEKTTSQNVADVLGGPKRKAKAVKAGEDEEAPAAPVAVAKPPEPGAAADAKDNADPAQPADANAPADSAAPADPNQKKISNNDILNGKKDDEPEKAELPKKGVNPFAPKTIAVTATEPTVMKLDIEKIGGNDKTMSEQLQALLPNWRIRDSFMDNSKINMKINGRENVIQLNPMNDVLPAKLMCTMEIPKNYAGLRPTLLFEASSAAANHDWLLCVRAMNVELIPKSKIVSKKDAEWTPVAISLAPLADKHFDLQIEVYSSVKGQKKVKDELGLIRNVRIEWSGMKK